MFLSLSNFNYRLWACGALVSNIGTWMQRTAQYWLVLTELTRNNGAALGIVLALQSGPQLVLFSLTGLAADHWDRRKLLMATQAGMGAIALAAGVLIISGLIELWHIYLLAFALGCVSAFDVPARQSFVAELVGEDLLANAVALNATSMSAAQMIGPAIAGLLIVNFGTGSAFIMNAVSFLAVLASLRFLRVSELKRMARRAPAPGIFTEGFRYIWNRRDLRTVFFMYFLIGTFGLNFPIFISTMAVKEFRVDAGEYGLLASALAVGAVIGALLATRRSRPNIRLLIGAAVCFAIACLAAALTPNYWLFGITLVTIGICSQTFSTSANSLVQLSSEVAVRGRVMAIYVAVAVGGTPLGAPIVGWVADRFSARWAMTIAVAAGVLAAAAGYRFLARSVSAERGSPH